MERESLVVGRYPHDSAEECIAADCGVCAPNPKKTALCSHPPSRPPKEALVTANTGIFVKPGHSDECYLADQGREEFVVYKGMSHNLRRDGQRGGSTTWHKFRCNCLKCDAVAYVRWDVLMIFIAGLVHASKEATS